VADRCVHLSLEVVMKLRRVFLLGLLAIGTTTAHADTISYTFSSFLFDVSFTASSIITTDTTIPAADLITNNTPNLISIEINPISFFCGGNIIPVPDANSCFLFNQPAQGSGYFFSSQLTSLGTYNSGNAMLTISAVGATPAVPEPSALLLLITGLGMLFMRRVSGWRPSGRVGPPY
jgi:hypothetical protein